MERLSLTPSRWMTLGALGLALAPFSSEAAENLAICPIAVVFSSHCCGPDAASRRATQDLLQSRRFRSARTYVYGWGIEGEATLCVYPGKKKDALLRELERIVAEAKPPADVPPPVIRLNESVSGRFRGRLKRDR